MESRLIFLHLGSGVMRGWRRVAMPVIGFRFMHVGGSSRLVRKNITLRCDVVDFGPEDGDPILTRKAAKR